MRFLSKALIGVVGLVLVSVAVVYFSATTSDQTSRYKAHSYKRKIHAVVETAVNTGPASRQLARHHDDQLLNSKRPQKMPIQRTMLPSYSQDSRNVAEKLPANKIVQATKKARTENGIETFPKDEIQQQPTQLSNNINGKSWPNNEPHKVIYDQDQVKNIADEHKSAGNLFMDNDRHYLHNINQKQPSNSQSVDLSEKLVHFDLKGAPPRVSYFKKMLLFLKRAGATGILVEWEDMLPYSGELQVLRSGYAYSKQDVEAIRAAAGRNDLKLVPLVQTFGHMEWMLKHKEFSGLREIGRYPQVICPSNPNSFPVVKMLIDQVMRLHPSIDSIHIGADEAFYIGDECTRCQQVIRNSSKEELMLSWVSRVAEYIKTRYKLQRVFAWYDMFQHVDESLLRKYRMAQLVTPVIWKYDQDLIYSNVFPEDLFQRFGAIFPHLWIGSAFKGANGAAQSFIDQNRYLQNQQSWAQVIDVEKVHSNFQGIILTGWQRFDHFAVLCELLPVGFRSLITDLLFWRDRNKPSSIRTLYDKTQSALKCDYGNTVERDTASLSEYNGLNAMQLYTGMNIIGDSHCDFPGANVSALIQQLLPIRQQIDQILDKAEVKGWLSAYNLHHGYGNVFFAEKIHQELEPIVQSLKFLGSSLRGGLSRIFFDDTVTEWLVQNVQADLNRIKDLARGTLEISHTVAFRNRPLDKDNLDF